MQQSEKVDTRDLGLQVGNILGKFLFKTEHLHYGYWPEDLEVSFDNLSQSQKNYTEFLLSHIPENVKTILDVGCGVGENAHKLLQKGYKVDCVSPSPFLTGKTREKVQDKSEIFECFFEDLQTDKKYDLILFSESFQYIKLVKSIPKALGLLNPEGYILISDFFKIPGEGTSPMGGGHKLARFHEVIGEYPLTQLKDLDITKETAPNMHLVDEALQTVALPIKNLIDNMLKCNYKILYKIALFIANLFWKKRLKKLEFKYLSGERNAESFKKFKSYRLFVYQKNKE